jgi:hypothetical protein
MRPPRPDDVRCRAILDRWALHRQLPKLGGVGGGPQLGTPGLRLARLAVTVVDMAPAIGDPTHRGRAEMVTTLAAPRGTHAHFASIGNQLERTERPEAVLRLVDLVLPHVDRRRRRQARALRQELAATLSRKRPLGTAPIRTSRLRAAQAPLDQEMGSCHWAAVADESCSFQLHDDKLARKIREFADRCGGSEHMSSADKVLWQAALGSVDVGFWWAQDVLDAPTLFGILLERWSPRLNQAYHRFLIGRYLALPGRETRRLHPVTDVLARNSAAGPIWPEWLLTRLADTVLAGRSTPAESTLRAFVRGGLDAKTGEIAWSLVFTDGIDPKRAVALAQVL